jgi:hypothetical protein
MRLQRSGFYRRKDGSERLWFSPADIETTMEAELHRLGKFPTFGRPAVDVEGVIQGLGLRIDQYAELESSVLGQTEFYADRPPKIFINRDLTGAIDDDYTPPGIRGRWRATLAHETSHVVLHRVLFDVNESQGGLFQVVEDNVPQRLMRCLKKNVLYRAGASDWREVQANMGMAALLMPKTLFLKLAHHALEQNGLRASALISGSSAASLVTGELARLFDVSKQAAGIRLETLGIVSPLGQGLLAQEPC